MKRQLQRDKVPLQPLHTIDVCSTGIGLRSKSRVSPERDSRRGRIAAVSKACIRFHGDRYTLLMCVVPATTVNRNKTRASPCGDSCGETRSRRNRYTLLMCVVPATTVERKKPKTRARAVVQLRREKIFSRYTLLMCVVPATTVDRNETRRSPCGDSCRETRSRCNRYTLLMCVVPAVGVRHYRVHRPSATVAVEG